MKKILIGSLLLVGLATGFAFAHGNGTWGGGHMHSGGHHYGMMGGGMMGPGMMGRGAGYDCPGGANWSGSNSGDQAANQKYLDETVELRKQMHDLRFSYMEAYRNPSTTRETLIDLERQMLELRGKLFDVSKQHGN